MTKLLFPNRYTHVENSLYQPLTSPSLNQIKYPVKEHDLHETNTLNCVVETLFSKVIIFSLVNP